jgi:selenide, water dikinase
MAQQCTQPLVAGPRNEAELVLVGGGHAHVEVLRRFAAAPLPGVRLHVVLDRPHAVYSGMVPGFVAGDYRADELSIDVARLASHAGANVVLAAATGVDASARRIELAGRAPLAYDVASLDVGATLRGRGLPGVREHALATRPIADLIERLDARLSAAPLRIALVGGGAAGAELAFCLDARLRRAGGAASLALFESADSLGLSRALERGVRSEAQRRGIAIRTGARTTGVEAGALSLGDERVAADLVVWATGAAPWPWLAASPLPRDAQGFVRVRPTLQVAGQDALFAAGDCAAREGAALPKAGVHAVRQGPLLAHNLRACLAGAPLRALRPQRDFLVLLNLGDRRALGGKWGFAARGRWVWRLKHAIDRRFMSRYPRGRDPFR